MSLNNIDAPLSRKRALPIWRKAKPENIHAFKRDLDRKIHQLDVPDAALFCRDVKCSVGSHKQDLDEIAAGLMDVLESAVKMNIPQSGSSRSGSSIPGWSTFIKPLKEDADFWSSVWISAGRPQNTELHRVARYTRNKYHRGIKKIKKCEDQLRQSSFLSDCLDGNVQDMLAELKKLKGNNSSPSLPPSLTAIQSLGPLSYLTQFISEGGSGNV